MGRGIEFYLSFKGNDIFHIGYNNIIFIFSFRALNNKETYTALRDALLGEKLVLESIDDSETESSANMEGVLQTVLIVVSVVLGLLVVVLFAAFFVRTRR
jgi:hypothetical protein